MHYTSIDLKSDILFDGLFIQTQENISHFTLQEKDSKNQINPKSNIKQSDMLWSSNQRSAVLSLPVNLTFSGKLVTRFHPSLHHLARSASIKAAVRGFSSVDSTQAVGKH